MRLLLGRDHRETHLLDRVESLFIAEILGKVDRPHAPLSNNLLDLVALMENGVLFKITGVGIPTVTDDGPLRLSSIFVPDTIHALQYSITLLEPTTY
ncbi:hypothetical protein ccbrp13_48370 [Ktedonobacteria bacterium brp13]|nr:hypothetical protein ccbrp13_48370 [Ktedonobacteria bacterium brp13]